MELKYATELFLGKYELQRLKESLDDNGFREFLLDDSLSFGLIKNTKDNTFSNGLVEVEVMWEQLNIVFLRLLIKMVN